MTIEFHCPACGKLLRTADDKAGVHAHCPDCRAVVTVPGEAASAGQTSAFDATFYPAARPSPAAAEAASTLPAAQDRPEPMRACPMCGAPLRVMAGHCDVCGEDLTPRDEFSVNTVMTRAWQLFQQQMPVCLAAGAIWIVLDIAFRILGQMLAISLQMVAPRNPWVVAVAPVYSLLEYVVQIYLLLGLVKVVLLVARGQPADALDTFRGGRFVLRALLAFVIVAIATLLIVAVCVGPGLAIVLTQRDSSLGLIVLAVGGLLGFALLVWLQLNLFFFMFYLVDRDTGTLESLRQARALTQGHLLQLLILSLIWGGLVIAGIGACCVGVFFTAPLVVLSQAVAYLILRGEPVATGNPAA